MKVVMQDKNGVWVMNESEVKPRVLDINPNESVYHEYVRTLKEGETYLEVFNSV